MPVRSLSSSVLAWPDRRKVEDAVRAWAPAEARRHPGLLCLGFFGSYARCDWGVGSDLDLVAVVEDSKQPFFLRAVSWDLSPLPVPVQLLVYTRLEWRKLHDERDRLSRVLAHETVWVFGKPP